MPFAQAVIASVTLLLPAVATADSISFTTHTAVSRVQDAPVDGHPIDCTAPFSPILVDTVFTSSGHFWANSRFFDIDVGEVSPVFRQDSGRRVSYESLVEVVPPIEPTPAAEPSSGAGVVEVVRPANTIEGAPLGIGLTLFGCGFGPHLDLTDGRLQITGDVGRYRIDVDTRLSDLWRNSDAAGLARYAPTLWSENEGSQGRATRMFTYTRTPAGYEDHDILGNLFLDFWFPHPVPHQTSDSSLLTDFTLSFATTVIDLRDPALAAQSATTPSRFISVTPLTDR